MRSPTTRTYDVRLHAKAGPLSLLVDADSHDEARHLGQQQAIAAGHEDARVEWCVEYPPARRVRPARAITD